jgi:hypothetical protein
MIKLAKKQASCFLLALLLMSLMPARASAWGGSGHRIVAMIAENHLSPRARQRVAELLGDDVSLASVANFADEIRNARPDTRQFHYVDIPLMQDAYVPTRDCKPGNEGDCVIAAIERFRQGMADTGQTVARRRFALMFLVHLVGDMHQPLHCADRDDRGGNSIKIIWFGRSGKGFNLHSTWDRLIIDEAGLGDAEFAEALEEGLTQARIQELQSGTVIQWAEDAHQLARARVYRTVTGNKLMTKTKTYRLGQAYYNRNFAVVDDQLLRAGLRLARILNEAFQ